SLRRNIMSENNNSRRDFMKNATLGAAGVMIASHASSYANILGANDRVRVGVVGYSDRCRQALIPAFMMHAKELNFQFVAGSDVEKPMANTMEDAKAIRQAVEETKKIVQIGSQRRSGRNYIRANEFINSGKFGDIVMVEMTWNVNQPGRWRRPQLVNEIRKQDTDWDRFLLNRREQGRKPDWDPRKYLEFRLFWPYSSGIPCQWMSHQIDTVHWFSGLRHPR